MMPMAVHAVLALGALLTPAPSWADETAKAGIVPDELEAENEGVLQLLDSFVVSLPLAAFERQGRARLDRIWQGASALRGLAETAIVDGYRLTAGFSSLDGD